MPSTKNRSNAYGTSGLASEATPTSTNTAQPVSSSHQQYGSTAYSWADRNPGSYEYMNGTMQNYRDTGWKDSQSQQPVYGYQRGQANYASSPATSHGQSGWYGASTQSQPQSSTQALSNLAYASGLDAQGQQAQDDRLPARSKPGSSQFNTTQRDTYSQTRVESPSYGLAYSSSNARNPQTFQSEQSPTSSHQSLAISAAAALAGAVNRRYSNSPQQGSISTQHHQPQAPSVADSGKQIHPNIPMSQLPNQPALSHGTNSRGQSQPQTQVSSNMRSESNHPVLSQPSSTPNLQPEPVYAAAQVLNQNNSVANDSLGKLDTSTLSATTSNAAGPVNGTARQQPSEPALSMPTFIDPSQVFNPYHKEHERQKREEAERAKRASIETSEFNAAGKVKEASIAAAVEMQATTTAASSRQQASKAATKDASVRSSSISSSATAERRDSVDVDMANEMKAMMQRMREWKTKDPTLFQKLWDDMKKGGNSAQPAKGQTPSHSPQLAQVETQQPPQSENLQASQLGTSQPAHTVSQTTITSTQPPAKPSISKRHWNLTMIIENNEERLPDLGRFPAERRIPSERRNRLTNKETAERKAEKEEPKLPHQAPAPIVLQSAVPAKQDEKLVWATKVTPQPDSTAEAPSVAAPTQPLPSMNPNGGTIWPEAKRKALAEAAQKALLGLTANKDKSITAADIHALLEQNPSYIELCTKLEARGFVFHRGQFARFLLNNVPDLASPVQAEHKGSQQAASPTAHPVKSPPQAIPKQITAPKSSQNTATHNAHPQPTQPRSLENGYPPAQSSSYQKFRLPSAPQPKATPIRPVKSRLGVPSPNIPTPVPGSKEANARKRDFSELVDLTQLSDDEDYVMPSKHPRHEPSPEPHGFQIKKDVSSLSALIPTPAAHSTAMQTHHGFLHYSPSGTPGGTAPLKSDPRAQSTVGQLHSQVPTQPPQSMPPRSRHLLAKPLNKAEALRKSYYDPKTVARDILIAAGRHPAEHPLNAHLVGLLGKHIDIDSDLSTFDWDTVDPGGPPMPVVPVVDIPAGPPRWKLGQTKPRGPVIGIFDPATRLRAEGEASMKPRGPVVGTSNSASKSRAEEGVRMSEPGYTKETTKEKPEKGQVPDIQTSIARLSLQTKSLLKESFPKAQKPSHQPTRLRETQNANVDEHTQTPPISSGTKTTPQSTKAITPISPSSGRSHKRGPGRPRKSSFMADSSLQPLKRPRGRPPGSKTKNPSMSLLKKAVRSSDAQVSLGTTSRSTSPQQYNVYPCQWRKCNAKLHNLPTLRKHIARVHKVSDEEIKDEGQPCWWKKCRTVEINGEEIVPKVTFNSTSDWLDHIDSDHLYPLGLKLGDGPSSAQTGKPKPFEVSKYFYQAPTTLSSSSNARTLSHTDPQTLVRDRQIYLSDPQGHSVTAPSTKTSIADYPSDTLTLSSVTMNPESNISNRAFSKAHGNEKMEIRQSAIETLLALQSHKEKVGPGLDRGGCTLVNEERRTTLTYNEGIARVVEGDY